jgi:hypothetical protein
MGLEAAGGWPGCISHVRFARQQRNVSIWGWKSQAVIHFLGVWDEKGWMELTSPVALPRNRLPPRTLLQYAWLLVHLMSGQD